MESTDRPIVLATFPTEFLASLLSAKLRSEGIFTEISGALTSAFRAEVPGQVQVLVRASEIEPASKILEEFQKQGQ